MRYLVFLGGSLSELGKGTALCGVGMLLKSCGLHVTVLKIDPYLNADAGTLSPEEHGEVFVLEDGSEVDLDFGNYERTLGLTLSAAHSITSGGIFAEVLRNERDGKYLGQTVRLAVHVMDAAMHAMNRAAQLLVDGRQPDVCLVELGGSVGDWDAHVHLEALRRLGRQAGVDMAICLLVPLLMWEGEHKTKLAQDSVRMLRGLGIQPDFLICRSDVPLSSKQKNKLSQLCELPVKDVWESIQISDLRHLPDHFREQGIHHAICARLGLTACMIPPINVNPQCITGKARIAILGKCVHKDAYLSVVQALEHAAQSCCIFAELVRIEVFGEKLPHDIGSVDAVCLPGGFGSRGFEDKVRLASHCRLLGVPFLGLCLGFQAAVVAFCRDILSLNDATSEEISPGAPESSLIVVSRPRREMKKGAQVVTFQEGSQLYQLHGKTNSIERFRNRYEVRHSLADTLNKAGLCPSARGPHGEIDGVELMLPGASFWVAVQYHPEFRSSWARPSPVFLGLLKAAIGKETCIKRRKVADGNANS
eukprot:TRINITY_DN72874_c0_g1_i1.p1 TRINITY_DN72874_c0_g1~~TRINITY_DN72874_c0_g1_i1.p1  ORF type:complete len:534 (-),score=69.85 TRINITY_DN72874_c0_g1_i1:300-1901(-)